MFIWYTINANTKYKYKQRFPPLKVGRVQYYNSCIYSLCFSLTRRTKLRVEVNMNKVDYDTYCLNRITFTPIPLTQFEDFPD